MRKQLEHATGRAYNGPQVLKIEVESESTDDFGLCDIVATFRDDSRGISGRVKTVVFSDGIGAAVLAAYDAGRYQTI